MTPRLLAMDLDGTLLNADGEPHPADAAAVRRAMDAGVLVTIVTGRLYSGTRDVATNLGIRGPVGCVDGSHVVSAETHTTLMHHSIAGDDAAHLREAMKLGGPSTFVFAQDRIGHDPRGVPYLGYVTTWSGDLHQHTDVFDHPYWANPEGVTSVVAIGSLSEIAVAANAAEQRLGTKVQIATFPIKRLDPSWGIVIRANAGDKGTALKWIAEHHGISLAETVCVGDWLNDVPMFRVAGRAFAMGQAPAEVKAHAHTHLEEDVNSGGAIARILKEVFGVD